MKRGVWIVCTHCGNGTGDAGVAIPAPFEAFGDTDEHWRAAEAQAIKHALDNGFEHDENGNWFCPFECNVDGDVVGGDAEPR